MDNLLARIQQGELVCPTNYEANIRPQFAGYIASIRDELPTVRPRWITLREQHVDGIRIRQRMFGIFPRQKGNIDPLNAVTLAVTAWCLFLAQAAVLALVVPL